MMRFRGKFHEDANVSLVEGEFEGTVIKFEFGKVLHCFERSGSVLNYIKEGEFAAKINFDESKITNFEYKIGATGQVVKGTIETKRIVFLENQGFEVEYVTYFSGLKKAGSLKLLLEEN